ncbi:MAG: hypothetical protein AAGH41_03160 [Pseudomonadota bacterium]
MGEALWPLRLLVLALSLGGAASLYAAWKTKRSGGFAVGLGWLLLLAATICAAFTTGADKGAALGIVTVIACAAGFLSFEALRNPRRQSKPREPKTAEKRSGLTPAWWGRRVFVGFLVGPIAGLAALSVTALLYVSLANAGLSASNNLVVAFFAFPLGWAGLAVWAGFDEILWRKSAVIGAALLAPLPLLAISG